MSKLSVSSRLLSSLLNPGKCQFSRITKSLVQGSFTPTLTLQTLPQFFKSQILPRYGDRPALISLLEPPRVHGGPPPSSSSLRTHTPKNYLEWNYEEFDIQIQALARGLIGLGVKKGERVGIIMGNSSAYAMLQWACASIGAILVTLNPAYRLTELIDALTLSGVSTIIVVPSLRGTSHLRLLAEALPGIRSQPPGEVSTPVLPDLRNLVLLDNEENEGMNIAKRLRMKCLIEWREILVWREKGREEKERRDREARQDTEEVVNLQFTSGTTGKPKAVSLTHFNLLNNAISIGNAMNFTKSDILCNVPPLFHCFGLVLGNLASFTHGASVVYPSAIFDPPKIVDALVKEKCTALHGVPTHFLGVLAEVEKRRRKGEQIDLGRLRTGIAAGSPIPIDLMRRLIDEMGLRDLTVAYGMTETSPVSFQSTPSDPILKRVETVGKVLPHVRAKVVDVDGATVDVGVPGEVLVTGYLIQKGYWNGDEHTASVTKRDGDGTLWMCTGDQGIMDDEGYLKIVGRVKDLIIRGGENLFPVQIENAVTAHSAIIEAAAVAIPDDVFGEVVGLWIVRNPLEDARNMTREGVRELVSGALRPQNAPAWVWFVGEDGEYSELPKTASGKIMKHVLREWSKKLSREGIGKVAKKVSQDLPQ